MPVNKVVGDAMDIREWSVWRAAGSKVEQGTQR
jgi:hypothetical protein